MVPTTHSPSTFSTGVIYFAARHDSGPVEVPWDQVSAERAKIWRDHRGGPELREYHEHHEVQRTLWTALEQELKRERGERVPHPWNLWLGSDGTIRTALSLFEEHSKKTDKEAARHLYALKGQQPMQVVLKRAERDELLRQAGLLPGAPAWRVSPELVNAIQSAITAYHTSRAPLYPLPKIQRLAFLDDQDSIRCLQDLEPFAAGQTYPIRSQTVAVVRAGSRPNLAGEIEELEFTGQDLALFIRPGDLPERVFLDARLLDGKTKLPGLRFSAATPPLTLQQLVDHFEMPEAPDVSALRPEQYLENKQRLEEIESLCQ